jgi:16S rRNA C967 or C1407 C5-methylase (RsmB/RsmF family)/NOL1/NOP2/fmu family ribosome biogenesis protein
METVLHKVAAGVPGLSAEDRTAFMAAHAEVPPVSIRLNPAKRKEHRSHLPEIPWCRHGLYLPMRPHFTFDPLHHAGAYYVQEASSMFVEQAMAAAGLIGSDAVALDLCAAPGGKSTHLLSLLGPGAALVSNEVVRSRTLPLCDNLTRWGHANVMVTSAPAEAFARNGELFDLVMVDAPCSGEGLIRREPEAAAHWSQEAVRGCAVRQRDILTHAWECLAPGGHLIYSTCTFNGVENEENLGWMTTEFGAIPVPIPLQPTWGVTEVEVGGARGYRFMPHRTKGEGFFLSLMKKEGRSEERDKNGSDLIEIKDHQGRSIITKGISELSDRLAPEVRQIRLGTEVAHTERGHEAPTHALALSTAAAISLPDVTLALGDAIAYLRGEPLRAQSARDYATVSYQGLRLGLVKGAGNRWNNLYPAPLRIRDRKMRLEDVVLPGL